MQVWHDDVLIPELRCEKALTAAQIAGISVSVSAIGLVLLAYLAYVSWYGRFGLPKLRRVSGGQTANHPAGQQASDSYFGWALASPFVCRQ